MTTEALYKNPPIQYLRHILKYYPRAALLYLYLWERQDKNNRVVITKSTIKEEYLMSPTRFMNDLYNLLDEGLVSFFEKHDMVSIELVGWDEFIDELD